MPRYASIVPAIRTVHGVDVFDYLIEDTADLQPGDIIRIPFRTRSIIGMIVSIADTSPFASKAVNIGAPTPLLRTKDAGVALLTGSASRCFTPRPSILTSWLRTVPKRAISTPSNQTSAQSPFPRRETRYALDRLQETYTCAQQSSGQVVIIVPWQHRAEQLAADLEAPCLHADMAAGRAWNAIQAFVSQQTRIIVTTRIGAWLSLFADCVILDEPENDDHKQDEMTPRLDARWTVSQAAQLIPQLSTVFVSTTPSVTSLDVPWEQVPSIEPHLTLEATLVGSRSKIDSITSSTLTRMEASIEEGRSCIVIHPIRGDRARFTCRDCGWIAPCNNCGFVLSRLSTGAVCRKCSKRATAPEHCINCGGLDLSRSVSGGDRLASQLTDQIGPGAQVVNLTDFWRMNIPEACTIVITNIALIGGVVEDIRRKERLVISFRRLAALCHSAKAHLIVQGDERLLAQCHQWLSREGLQLTWKKEQNERSLFGYPPSRHLAKLLIDGTADHAQSLYETIVQQAPSDWSVSLPLPVPYRPASRSPRFCLQLSAPLSTTSEAFTAFLQTFAGKAIIDLDPIAFFS